MRGIVTRLLLLFSVTYCAAQTLPCANMPALTGDASSTVDTCATVVNALKGVTLPTLTSGYLHYTGSAFAWDTPTGNTYTANYPLALSAFAFSLNIGGGLANVSNNLTTVGQQPAQIAVSFVGVPANSQVVIFIPITVSTVIASGCTNMVAGAKAAATGSAAFTVKNLAGGPTGSPTTYCTATWSASGHVAAITGAGGTFAPGDYLEIDGPGTADATLATIGFNVYGVR